MGTSPATGNRSHWKSRVIDPCDRERDVVISIRNGLVVTSNPPGEGFTQSPDKARELGAFYFAAADRAERDGKRMTRRRPAPP